MIFEAHFDPYVEDYDKNGRLTLPALLKLLENAGNRHSDKAGNAVIAGSASGFAWILTDWKVRIDEYPRLWAKTCRADMD
ncbi:MAG: hypothetical protein IJP62_01130 [Treponema sp.]|nr:hypothetical protein [Treponema sp.]